MSTANSSSFKYKSNLLKGLEGRDIAAGTNPDIVGARRMRSNAQIVVPLKYISIFFRSLELLLINTKLYIELNWSNNSVMSIVVGNTSFQVTKNLLRKRFKRSVFWNEYKRKIQTVTQAQNDNNFIRILLDSSFQGVNRLFLMGYNAIDDNANQVRRDDNRKYFLPRVDIKNIMY